MRLGGIELYSPAGGHIKLEAYGEGEGLTIERDSETAFIDIRDKGLPKHQNGRARLVAQVPTSWVICLMWEITEAPSMRPQLRAVEAIRHSGAVIPSDGCFCAECEKSRARQNPDFIKD